MPYSTNVNVQAEFAHITFDEEESPTLTEITTIIAEEDERINAALRQYWSGSLPITDANDIILLRLVSRVLTAGRVAKILYEERGDPNANTIAVSRLEEGTAMLDQIRGGHLNLATARDAWLNKGVFTAHDQVTPTTIVDKVKASGDMW